MQFVYQSTNVTYKDIRYVRSKFKVSSSDRKPCSIRSVSYSSSPTANSDGWDIYRSSFVAIRDSVVVNDDDCVCACGFISLSLSLGSDRSLCGPVAFKPNSTNIVVANMFCNGSHGVSVGSLGQYAGETDIVANVSVTNVTMLNAQNGARIKVFGGNPSPSALLFIFIIEYGHGQTVTRSASTVGGGDGFVKNITFKDFFGMSYKLWKIGIDTFNHAYSLQCRQPDPH